MAGTSHAVAASDKFLGQALRNLVERKRVIGRGARGPAAGGVGEESAVGIDLPDAVLEYVALQHDVCAGVKRIGVALAADAVINPRRERRAAHRETGDLHRAGAVLGLDRQGVAFEAAQQQVHRRAHTRRVDHRDLVGEVVHARIETRHLAACRIDVRDVRIGQRTDLDGLTLDRGCGRTEAGDRAVRQHPVGLARRHERLVERTNVGVLRAAVDEQRAADGIDALAHRREDLEVVALEDLVVARRHRHRLLPVPAIPVARSLREHQLRGDRSACFRCRQHHGRRACGLDRVAGRHGGALVGIGHCQYETCQRGAQGGKRPQLVVQAQRNRAQVVAVLDIVEVIDAVQRDGPALALGDLAREVELDLRCRELRDRRAAVRVWQDGEQRRKGGVITRIAAHRQRAAACRHGVAYIRRVDDALQAEGDIGKGGTRRSEVVIDVVQCKTPGLPDHRRAGQFDLCLRRRRIDLDRLGLAVIVACRECQVRVVGGGDLRQDVQRDVGRRRLAQDDLEGIRVRRVVRELGGKVVLDVEPVGRPDCAGKGLVERVGLRRRVVGEDARARSLVRPAGQRNLLADQADRVLVGVVPLQRNIEVVGLARTEADIAIAGVGIRLQVMALRADFDRIGAGSAQFVGMDRVGRERATGVRHRCGRIHRHGVDHDTVRIAQRQHRGVDVGVVLGNDRLIRVPQHGPNERIIVVDGNVDHRIVARDAVHDLALVDVEHRLHPAAALRAILREAGEPGIGRDHDPDVRAGTRRGENPAGVDCRAQLGGHAVEVVGGAHRRVVGDAVQLHRPDIVRRYCTRQGEVVLGQALGGGETAYRRIGRRLSSDPIDPGSLGDSDKVVVRLVELRNVGGRAVVDIARGARQRSGHRGAVGIAARDVVVGQPVRAIQTDDPRIAFV